MFLASLLWVDTTNNVGTVLQGYVRVEGGLLTGEPLDKDLGVLWNLQVLDGLLVRSGRVESLCNKGELS